MKPSPDPQYRHRFPAEVISHAVWPYHVFSLSLRDVELLLAERGDEFAANNPVSLPFRCGVNDLDEEGACSSFHLQVDDQQNSRLKVPAKAQRQSTGRDIV